MTYYYTGRHTLKKIVIGPLRGGGGKKPLTTKQKTFVFYD